MDRLPGSHALCKGHSVTSDVCLRGGDIVCARPQETCMKLLQDIHL